MRRALQAVFIAGVIGFAVILTLTSASLPPTAKKGAAAAIPIRAAYPLSVLIGLGVSVCCIFGSALFLVKTPSAPPVSADTGTDTSVSVSEVQDTIDQTLQRLDDLAVSFADQSPSAETLRRARAYVVEIGSLLCSGGVAWKVPEISRGQAGSVVLLWQNGRSYLSLSFRDIDETGGSSLADWVFDPGRSYGDIVMLNFAHTLQGGTVSPAEFVASVWSRWIGGQEPVTV